MSLTPALGHLILWDYKGKAIGLLPFAQNVVWIKRLGAKTAAKGLG